MEYFEADINLDTTDELDTEYSEDFLEKMDDCQFVSYVESHCNNLQKSYGITEDEWIKHRNKNSLIWEKSFEHEILLDVDDDFNLNFNDICDSYTICLSQSSAEDVSVNLTPDDICKIEKEYNGSDEAERINTEEINYQHNQDIHSSNYSDAHDETKDNLEGYKYQDIAASTSDEEQEELPYDSNLKNVSEHHTDIDLGSHVPPLSRLLGNPSGNGPGSGMSQNIPLRDQRSIVKNMFSQQEVSDTKLNTEVEASSHESKREFNAITSEQPVDLLIPRYGTKAAKDFQLGGGRSSISESVQHYFFEEDQALSSTMYIDSETLPETSFTDSIEETVIKNQISSNSNNELFMKNNIFCKSETDLSKKEETDGKFENNEQLVQVIGNSHCNRFAEVNVEKNGTCRGKTSYGLETPPKVVQEENEQAPLSHKTASETAQNPVLKMGRTISYNEIKYGKGKQHYPLLDFSKVAPKVRIPKRNTYNNYKCPRSRFKKTKSSPNSSENLHAIHKSTVDVLQNIPDNTQLSVIATKTEVNSKKQHVEANQTLEHFQQLQEEFDKLLIKYAEAENTIDQLRFGGKVTVTSDLSKSSQMIHSGILSSPCQLTIMTSSQQPRAESVCTTESVTFFPLESTHNNYPMSLSVTSAGSKPDSCQPISEFYKATGEQMAQKLNNHIEYFKHKVEDFKNYLNSKLIPVEDKQQEFKELRDGLDKLERIYIATKDEHRNLQHRCYLEKSTTVGEFDPDREIEGEIFRIGMVLENIKDEIDEDICNQSSLHSSIFTPTPLSIPKLSARHAVYSEGSMTAITQEGPREAHEGSLLNDESATQKIVQMQTMTNENNKSPLLKDTYSLTSQRKSPIVPTKAKNNINSSVYLADLSLNGTSELQNISFRGQELVNEFKQQILLPDSGFGTSEGGRPTTATQTLDSDQPQMERNSSLCEQMSSSKLKLHNANGEPSSIHTDENINEVGNNKVRQLLQMAVPSGCTASFNWHKPIIDVADPPAQQGEAFLQLDFLTEYSDDHIPLPNPQQCTPKISLQQTKCDIKKNESLSQPSSTRNEEIMELQQEVAKLKQKLEESLSKLSNDPKTKKVFEPLLQKQGHNITSCCRKKTSSRSSFSFNGESVDRVKLTNNSLKHHKRGHSTWLRTDDDASDAELSSGMDFFSDTEASVHSKQSFLETSRTAHHRQTYSRNYKSNSSWSEGSHKGLSLSSDGQNLQRRRMNTSILHNKNIPFKRFSERSSRRSRSELTSSVGISSTAANKYSEMSASISPIRSTIEYPPISRVSRNYYSPSYEIIKTGLQCLPNQIYSTKYFWRNCTDKSISIPQILHLNTNLDRAIEAANNMKKTTRRMVKILSADLAKTEYYKYLHDF
ncbi:uncharacterized protein LOC127567730 isoform X1 [Pristis pectinata]|uniref:uncharacterized protein LOC127567730 isoform X1 n=1 Tax=Pristis pectinata TaxID=685728 RepID=UPI00223DBE71|nr:uncharacterized protein LOC127567730 isoform X1 [Pristis pectinata]XP_051866669.1 uncharacterized protein LOC127567730 isoform X1 [Pristis pectinata]